MSEMTLLIGNRNYSSWSMRAWLALACSKAPFTLERVPLFTEEWAQRRRSLTPTGLVPVLRHGTLEIWDSLAISEYVNEQVPGAIGWPADPVARARARSVSCEMHSGFSAMRETMPMNCRRRLRDFSPTDAASEDIRRILTIWIDALNIWGGPYLFGSLSIADLFYAPVVSRFQTYGITLPAQCAAYSDAILALPEVVAWMDAALAEPEAIAAADAVQ